MTGPWGSVFRVTVSTCSSFESGTGETRGAATGEGLDLAGKQRKIRRRKYERKEAYRSSTTVVTQAILVASRSQWDSRAACTDFLCTWSSVLTSNVCRGVTSRAFT